MLTETGAGGAFNMKNVEEKAQSVFNKAIIKTIFNTHKGGSVQAEL